MAPRKKKSDLATVTTKLNSKKATPNVLDAQFTKTETPTGVGTAAVAAVASSPSAALPGLGDLPDLSAPAQPIQTELLNARTGTVTPGPTEVRASTAPVATATAPAAGPAPSKYKAFDHIQANIKGGVDVQLAPCTAIVGPNRSRKTAVLDSIKLAILGTHPGVADRPTDLLAFASSGAANLTATISSPNGTLTTMLADAPGFKRPTHEASGELNDLLAAVEARQIVPTVAIGELLTFGETRMREAVFKRFGHGVEVKMPDGLSEEQQTLWLSTEALLRGGENGEAVEPTYANLAEKFRQLKLEAGRQLKRSDESAEKARAELGDAVLIPKDQVDKLHADLERLTKEGEALAQASRVNREYQLDKENFVRAYNELPAVPENEGDEPAFGTPVEAIDLAPLRKAKDEAGALAEQDEKLLMGLDRIVVAAEKTGMCPCCRASGGNTVADIKATHAAVTKRLAERRQAANDAVIALTQASNENTQRAQAAKESTEHIIWRTKRAKRIEAEEARVRLAKNKEILLARKAALPPEPTVQQLADADQAVNEVREQLKKITVQAGQVAVLESHETEARKARNHKSVFEVLEREAKTALQRSLERVRKDALACINRYVPTGWEVKLTLDDGACRWEIVGADGQPHGKGVASGSEWTTLCIALACAWTEGSPLRVLLVDDDDLGKLSPETLKAFLDRLREVVEAGWLTQAVVAWTRPDEIPAGWTKVQR